MTSRRVGVDEKSGHVDEDVYYRWLEHLREKAELGLEFELEDGDLGRFAPVNRQMLVPISNWCASFTPPKEEIKGLLKNRHLYTVTGPTGHGKTAVFLTVAVYKAMGWALGQHKMQPGNVVYLAGENPEDVRYRCILMADQLGLDLSNIPLYIIEGTFDFEQCFKRIHAEIKAVGGCSLLIVDTGPAFQAAWGFDDENNNMQILNHSLRMRRFADELPGTPATVELVHPTKNATRDNLLPRDGGARSNHVDGNLTLWADGDRAVTELHWSGKFRGAEFEPLTFALERGTSDRLVDSDGSYIPSVCAAYLNRRTAEKVAKGRMEDDGQVLRAMLANPGASYAALCQNLGEDWFLQGKPYKSRVQRAIARLSSEKLVHRVSGKYVLTKAGQNEAKKRQE